MKDAENKYFKMCKRCLELYKTKFKYSKCCIKCNLRDKNIKKIGVQE